MTDVGGAPGADHVAPDPAFTMSFALDTFGTVVGVGTDVGAGDTCGAAVGWCG